MSKSAPAIPPIEHWSLEFDDAGIGWLAIDKRDASANVLSRAVMGELQVVLSALEATPLRGLVIHSKKEGSFIAGADINEFPAIRTAADASNVSALGQQLLLRLESLPFPTVSVLNGVTLGGGLELTLATTWRLALAVEKPCLGLPEVQLGLHPGFGGTVRIVRLLGVRKGMELMLTGRSITVEEALACGLVDRVVPGSDWRQAAIDLIAREPLRRKVPLVDSLLATTPVRGFVARGLRQKAARKANPRHYPAPFAMIDLWCAHGGRRGMASGFEAEAGSFGRLAVTETSRNLVRVFFLQDRLKKLAGRALAPIERVHVVGAGVMGGDIAAWCALQGLQVTLQDREAKFIEPALTRAEHLFQRRLVSPAARLAARQRLRADVAGDGAQSAGIVIEAIFEDLAAKQDLLRSLEKRVPHDCVLATNTSSIPVEDLAGGLQNPSRLIGLHFFNPVAKLPLVEVVQTPATSTGAAGAGLAFVRQLGKLPLPCRSRPGFLVNRILAPYLAEAMTLAQEGIPIADIDRAATDFGMPMGPIELADSVGLDIALKVAHMLAPLLGRPIDPELQRKVASGALGVKTGQGFYRYQDRRPVRSPTSGRDLAAVRERLVMALLNESAQCLQEKIVDDADLIDAGVIFGTGFAPFRGGPLHYAVGQGIDGIIASLTDLTLRLGPRFKPSAGWQLFRDR